MNIKKLTTQVKREIWENKVGFFWVPIIVSSLLALFLCWVTVNYKDVQFSGDGTFNMSLDKDEKSVDAIIENSAIENSAEKSSDDAKKESLKVTEIIAQTPDVINKIVYGSVVANGALLTTVFFIILLAYAHSTLFEDRKNREVLFWRSMPISETANVLVKLAMIILPAPFIMLVLNLLIGLLVIVVGALVFISVGLPLTTILDVLSDGDFIGSIFKFFLESIHFLILLSPVAGFILFCSALAKKSPFFTSSVIPIVLIIADKVVKSLLGVNLHIISTLKAYWHMLLSVFPSDLSSAQVTDGMNVAVYLAVLLAASLFVAGTIWLRNNRYEL
ncbi:MAG: hypothetical protein EOO68_00520 [Moraxellaceae bacterium]|nr:MAG: hypothetical protein EOO68_00520 [Moraxellaceae bacterium]